LIEIAIVLVIIGLLLAGVLKGQELINSAKFKNLAGDFKSIPVFIYGYQDKYKALPGDDANAQLHLGPTAVQATTPGTVGNGAIEGAWNSIITTDESFLFWQHVRLAGFGPGSIVITDPSYLPKNTLGGSIGVTNSSTNFPITGIKGTYVVCSDSIPGKFAKQLDAMLDDGNPATGSLMISTVTIGGAPMVDTAHVLDDNTYLVCMGY